MKKVFEKLGVTLEHRKVGNLDVWHFNKSKAPFSVYLDYATGAINDTTPGITHFLEHILVSGTKTYPTKKALADYSVEKGWGTNAYTSRLMLSFPIWANNTDDVIPALTLLNEYIYASVFDPKTIEKERTAIFDEIQRAASDTDRTISEKRASLLYPGSPLVPSVLGTKESVASITREDLLRTLEQTKCFPRALISIGDCEIETVLKAIPETLASEKIIKHNPPRIDLKVGTYTAYISNLKGAQVEICYPTKDFGDRKREVVRSFLEYLLLAQNGLFMNTLRYEKGLTYHVDGIGLFTPYYEYLGVSITCGEESIAKVIDASTQIFEKDVFEHITEENRRKYLQRREARLLKDWETSDGWLDAYEFDFLYLQEKTVYHDEWEMVLTSLSIEEIKNIAREVFNPKNKTTITFLEEKK